MKLVPLPGTSEGVVELLSEALCRAQDDETLAVAVIEVGHQGDIAWYTVGEFDGFKHQLVAGLVYALDHVKDER